MDLLSNEQRAKIRLALRDVADTFNKVPVMYTLSTGETLDRFNRGMGTKAEAQQLLMAQVEYKDSEGNFAKELPEGLRDEASIKMTFNMDDLTDLGLINPLDHTHPFRLGSDTFICQSRKYKTLWVAYDGFFEEKSILLVMYGAIRNNVNTPTPPAINPEI